LTRPRILLATTCRWPTTARLAMAFVECGCEVDLVSPGGHPAATTRSLCRNFAYNGLAPTRTFRHAIVASEPDLIVPCDDLATRHLHDLHDLEKRSHQTSICRLIDFSLGESSSFAVVDARINLLALAQHANIRTPKSARVTDGEELRNWLENNGFPAVLKSDGSWGGVGVKVVRTFEEAADAFEKLHKPPSMARAFKRSVANRDATLLRSAIFRKRPQINIQKYISGRDASLSIACWEGELLASVNFEVFAKGRATGPSSVVHLIENEEMAQAACKMARRLGLSGLIGFDFVLENGTGNPYLIEVNPRATQICHLALGDRRDLPAALVAALTREPLRQRPITTGNETIAFFPQEWAREPESDFLKLAYHDVPWSEPGLVKACMKEVSGSVQRAAHRTIPVEALTIDGSLGLKDPVRS
jgi:hypothetical protein